MSLSRTISRNRSIKQNNNIQEFIDSVICPGLVQTASGITDVT